MIREEKKAPPSASVVEAGRGGWAGQVRYELLYLDGSQPWEWGTQSVSKPWTRQTRSTWITDWPFAK
jgi:hypothetical protein